MYGLLPKELLKSFILGVFRTFSSKQIPLKITFEEKKHANDTSDWAIAFSLEIAGIDNLIYSRWS
jgi:hypothetical protein